MNGFKEFVRRFLNNKGQYIFSAMVITKVCSFLGSVLIIRLLSDVDFGKITIVTAVFNIFVSATGLGLPSGLLRYGSIQDSPQQKKQLENKLFREGFAYQVILSVLFMACIIIYLHKLEQILLIFSFFAIRLLGFFFFNHVQSELRVNYKNKQFAVLNSVFSLVGLALILVLTYYFSLIGYLIAIAVIPYVSLFWLSKKRSGFGKPALAKLKEIRWYSFYSVINGILNDLLYSFDILLLSFLVNEIAVAQYKVALLIPRNLVFLSIVFMQSDYISIAENYRNKNFLKDYVVNYYKLFIPVTVLIFIVFYLFKGFIIVHLFGQKYAGVSSLFTVLLIAFLASMLMRNLYGNILAAIGRIRENLYVTTITIFLMIPLALILTPKYNEMGMAITVLITVMASNILYVFYFKRYLRRLR